MSTTKIIPTVMMVLMLMTNIHPLAQDKSRIKPARSVVRSQHRAIADYCEKNGGFISLSDLAAQKSDWVEPISTNYRGYTVYEILPLPLWLRNCLIQQPQRQKVAQRVFEY